MDLSKMPVVLYRASIERINSAHRAFNARDHVLAMFLAGLAVECVLQTLALRSGASRDPRHDLSAWLAKCPAALQAGIKRDVRADWSRLVALWDNGIRYLSHDGLLEYLRDKGASTGISGGPRAVVRQNVRLVLAAATEVHKKGLSQWLSNSTTS